MLKIPGKQILHSMNCCDCDVKGVLRCFFRDGFLLNKFFSQLIILVSMYTFDFITSLYNLFNNQNRSDLHRGILLSIGYLCFQTFDQTGHIDFRVTCNTYSEFPCQRQQMKHSCLTQVQSISDPVLHTIILITSFHLFVLPPSL